MYMLIKKLLIILSAKTKYLIMKFILKIIVLGVVISLLFITPVSEPIVGDLHPMIRIICNISLFILGWEALKSAGKEACHYMTNKETDYQPLKQNQMKKSLLLLLPIAIIIGIISTFYNAYITFIGHRSKWDIVEFILVFVITIFFILLHWQLSKPIED